MLRLEMAVVLMVKDSTFKFLGFRAGYSTAVRCYTQRIYTTHCLGGNGSQQVTLSVSVQGDTRIGVTHLNVTAVLKPRPDFHES